MELRRKREARKTAWGGERHMCFIERATLSSVLRVFIWRSQGRIPIEYASAFQVCPFRVVVSTDWLASGQGTLVNAAGPDVSHVFACLVLLFFWAWS